MRRIAIINQKGGVGKTTTVANLGAALARAGKRVLALDLDPQANLSMYLGAEIQAEQPSAYSVLCSGDPIAHAVRPTNTPGLELLPSHIDLSGAELELATTIGRETILRDALGRWIQTESQTGNPVDFILIDCPPSLGLLSINALCASNEVLVVAQTEFFALQGLTKLLEIVDLVQARLNPSLKVTGVLATIYDARLRLAREVLGELRSYFPNETFRTTIGTNVRLAESPSHAQTIFEYAPESRGARDYTALAMEMLSENSPPSPKKAAEIVPAKPVESAAPAMLASEAATAQASAPAGTPNETPPSASSALDTGAQTALEEAPEPVSAPVMDRWVVLRPEEDKTADPETDTANSGSTQQDAAPQHTPQPQSKMQILTWGDYCGEERSRPIWPGDKTE